MSKTVPTLHPREPTRGDPDPPENEAEALAALADETGIDLTGASMLDADNVPADEESDRVVQAPD